MEVLRLCSHQPEAEIRFVQDLPMWDEHSEVEVHPGEVLAQEIERLFEISVDSEKENELTSQYAPLSSRKNV